MRFQHGDLNNAVETMGGVISEYSKCRGDISRMRESILDIRRVISSKKGGKVDLKQLWFRKKEQEEKIRILDAVERLAVR